MYLSLLNSNEKELFLGLAYNLAICDGNYSVEEKNIMSSYCQEMQYEFNEETMVKPTDYLSEKINLISNNKIKKIILFELTGLAMIDGNYDAGERALIKSLSTKFNIESNFLQLCEIELNKYIELQMKLNRLVLE